MATNLLKNGWCYTSMWWIISEFFSVDVFEYVEIYSEEENNNVCGSITTEENVYIHKSQIQRRYKEMGQGPYI